MTERLADISARIDNVAQLDAVVTAMRGIAAARAQQSRALLAGIEAYAQTVSRAIGQTLAFLDEAPAQSAGGQKQSRAVILFCAEQGFAGGFSDRVLDTAAAHIAGAHGIVVGTRGAAIAAERGLDVAQTVAMASQIGGVSDVANRIADMLYASIAEGAVTHADVFYPWVDADHSLRVERLALFPLDLQKFPRPQVAIAPLVTLQPQSLIESLAAEYIYARLCEAAMHAFAAENQARMEAMSSAGRNIDRTLLELKQRENQVRQEEVTAEIVELAAGSETMRTSL
ncbi:MAG TPA: FoF1 ATP synthase subunit gamma [Rhizomicrobium sp.]|nr:FoF1 ATP synthase subunit gamma [Rhizomicrobium sp.]